MTCQTATCRWAWCPGCGRERRLTRKGLVMRAHNRWDPTAGVMVGCEGSGQPPRLTGYAQAVRESPALQAAGDDAAARPREGAA